jgi:hypothetical protein
MHKYSETYLFNLNDKDDIHKWITQLKYFVFERAFGGHANDSDDLSTLIMFDSIEDLYGIAGKLGIDLTNLNTETKEKISKEKLDSSCFLGHQQIIGFRWGIFVSNKAIVIYALNSKPYCISNIDYEACKQFESKLLENKLENKVPTEKLKESLRAITIDRYKNYFDNQTEL